MCACVASFYRGNHPQFGVNGLTSSFAAAYAVVIAVMVPHAQSQKFTVYDIHG